MSYSPGQKPPQWSIDPGVVAYNASRLGLPMPVALWAMWEKGGDKVYDLSGHGRAGIITGANWCLSHLYFDGNQDYISIPYALPGGANPFTLIINFAVDDFTAKRTIIEQWGGTDNQKVLRLYTVAGTKILTFRVAVSGGNSDISSGALNESQEYKVACVYDGNNQYLYLDGILVASGVPGAIAGGATVVDIIMGIAFDYSSADFSGTMKYSCFYSYALTPQQIQAIYNNPYGLIADPYQIETLGFVAAGGGISIPVVMQQMNQFNGGQLII